MFFSYRNIKCVDSVDGCWISNTGWYHCIHPSAVTVRYYSERPRIFRNTVIINSHQRLFHVNSQQKASWIPCLFLLWFQQGRRADIISLVVKLELFNIMGYARYLMDLFWKLSRSCCCPKGGDEDDEMVTLYAFPGFQQCRIDTPEPEWDPSVDLRNELGPHQFRKRSSLDQTILSWKKIWWNWWMMMKSTSTSLRFRPCQPVSTLFLQE